MVKTIAVVKHKPAMTVEAFQEYWRTTHAAVVSRLPGLRRYVQSHTLLSGYRKGEPVFDGIAELWFDDTQAMRVLAGTAEYEAVQADEARFIDRERMATIVTEEHVIEEGPAPLGAVKNIEFLRAKPGIAVEEFQRYWREVHGPLAAAIPQVRRYVQSHTRLGIYRSGRAPAFDGVALVWFDDTDAMRASARTSEYARVRADEPNFIVVPAPFIITREHVVVG
jgi:uncharacterized protein (TIGR02118 family)